MNTSKKSYRTVRGQKTWNRERWEWMYRYIYIIIRPMTIVSQRRWAPDQFYPCIRFEKPGSYLFLYSVSWISIPDIIHLYSGQAAANVLQLDDLTWSRTCETVDSVNIIKSQILVKSMMHPKSLGWNARVLVGHINLIFLFWSTGTNLLSIIRQNKTRR